MITVQITKQIFEKETRSLKQEVENKVTPKEIINQVFRGNSQNFDNLHQVSWAGHDFEDSSGRKFVLDENSPTSHKLSELRPDDEWRLRINSHVNGMGYTKLEIKEIQIMK